MCPRKAGMFRSLGSSSVSTSMRPHVMLAKIILFAGLAIGCASQRPPLPSATGGVLDLRSWDFQRDGVVRLKGDWDFFPRVLLRGEAGLLAPRSGERRVPDLWTDKTMGSARGIGAGLTASPCFSRIAGLRSGSSILRFLRLSSSMPMPFSWQTAVGRPSIRCETFPHTSRGWRSFRKAQRALSWWSARRITNIESAECGAPSILAISRLSSVGTGPGRRARSPWPRPWPFWPYYSHSSLEEASKAGVLYTFASFP